ncbi:nonribosomal peptide synthetase [Cenococcum geophilum]
MALWVVVNDKELANMTGVRERLWGYSKNVGMISGYSMGYYLWELATMMQNTRFFSAGMLLHSVCALVLLIVFYQPFFHFYTPWFILYHLSVPFLHIHWFCDVLDMTGSNLQLCNGLALLSIFFWSRIICGNYQSLALYQDLWTAYCNNYSPPHFDSGIARLYDGNSYDEYQLWFAGVLHVTGCLIALARSIAKTLHNFRYITVPMIARRLMAGLRGTAAEKETPSTEVEFEIQRLWADILEIDVDAIGVNDNFFQLGGDSIQAVMLVAAARARGLQFTVADVFATPTMSDLSLLTAQIEKPANIHLMPFKLLSEHGVADTILDETAILCNVQRDSIEDSYSCTPLQEALMTLSLRMAGAYVARHLIELESVLDIDRFRAAWETVMESSPILRTRIIQSKSCRTMLQVVVKEHSSWAVSSDLDAYLESDKQLTMGFGEPLNRCAIVEDASSARRCLVWTMHHAIYDGWSLSLIAKNLVQVYEGAALPSPTKFNRFIEYVVNTNGDAAREFWQSQLSGSQPSTFPAVPDARYHIMVDRFYSRMIPVSKTTNMNITTPTIIRAAWALLMSKYEQSNTVVIGVTMAGRNAPVSGIEDIIGPTIATMPIRVNIDPGQRIGTYLEAIQKQSTTMIPFEQYGLQNIKALSAETQSACEFQNLLVIHPTIWRKDIRGIGTAKLYSNELANDKTYPLVMECTITTDGIQTMASFDCKMADEHQIGRVTGQFEHVLKQLLSESSEVRVGDVRTLSQTDQRDIWAWNRECPEAVDACVHELVAQQVLARPDASAVCGWDASFSYRELDELSTRLAHHLVGLGVGPETFVPLCFEKSAWAVVAMLAVLKAGGAYVSLNPSHPMSRNQDMICELSASVLLTGSSCYKKFGTLVPHTICVSWASVKHLPAVKGALRNVAKDNTAFIVFTSGSTGKPKGIVMNHGAFCTSSKAHAAALCITRESRVMQFASYTYDVSMGEIFTTLMHGGCVCVPSEEDRLNNLARAINNMNANWLFLTPTVAGILQPPSVPRLKVLVLGGEHATTDNVKTWANQVTLINSYGPAECAIWTSCTAGLEVGADPANLGRRVGGIPWVAEVNDSNKLSPIGCVGELLIEGPILAREYLNNQEKTAAAFIEDPPWAEHFGPGRRRRFYKTGDLVRYNSDGTLNFIGRKDTQVKLHGQRLEPGEVEHYLTSNNQVSNAMVIMPMKGYCQGRLVAVIAFQESTFTSRSGSKSALGTIGNRNLQLVDKSQKEIVAMQITRIRKHLSSQIPTYMVPTLWIVVEAIPLTTSGKLDRVRVGKWVQEMDEEMYSQIVDVEIEETMRPMTTMDRQLQDVLAQVLNLPEERISLNRSFLSLGGDSITAMQVVSRARAKGIAVKVQDILQSQTISQLALVATTSNPSSMLQGDEVDTVFDLSPIQQMYFEMEGQNANRSNYHFNQSFFLRLTREVLAQDLARAIETLVRQHSMLRARFRRAEDGRWGQLITKDAAESYRLSVHEVTGQGEVTAIIAASQASLDFENGPVFAADMFNVADDGQLLFLVAHHLVIDLVSWRVILQEIEEMLESGALSVKRSFPFQAWCKLQAEHAQQHLIPSKVLPFDIAPADYAYWGMANQANVYGDMVSESFTTDADMTSTLLGSCHKALGTEPVEVFVATLLHAFRQTFIDRAMPTVFSEGHGREPWDQEVDLSGTIGWFTTMAPLHVPVLDGADVVDMVRRTKDTRRRLPGNGWPYFTSRFLNIEGAKAFGSHFPMEILFNYLGRYQQLEREDGLLRLEPQVAEVAVPDVGQGVQRLALFEISVVVVQGVAYFRIVYNRNMQRQPDVGRWMRAWEQSLQEAAERLSRMSVERTLSDFPLLSLTYPGLDKVKNELLRVVGVASFDDVEDIYPCSPMQQGLLLNQIRTPGVYKVAFTFKVISSQPRAPVEVEKLLLAWQKVVDRHAILRTVFVDSVSKEGLFDQLVLRRVATRTVRKVCAGADTEALAALGEQEPMDYSEARPPHQLTVCQMTSGKVFCKLEISHAIIDATSRQVLLRDLNLAYEGALPSSLGMLYSDYIKYVQDRPHAIAMEFWKEYLAGVKPCVFPLSSEGTMEARQLKSMDIDLNVMPGRLRAFCDSTGVTVSTVLKTVWALILRCYTGSDQVCFGYLTSGRDVAVDGIEDAIGPFINMLVCCMDMRATSQMKQLIEQVQVDYLAGLEHQHCSLAQIQHGLNLSGRPLFNTAMSIQRMPSDNAERQTTLLFQGVGGHDPTEYDIVVTGMTSNKDVSISLSYWSSSLTDWQAVNLASAFAKAFQSVLDGDWPLSKLDLFSDRNWSQVLKWNRECPEAVDACVHELVAQQVLARPDASAVCGWDASFSYRELDDLSTRLAHHLMGLGVGPETFVPLCFEKSAWMIVAMLAVLKAGGACVPLNPQYPIGRLQAIIASLDADLVISSPSNAVLFEGIVNTIVPIASSSLPKRLIALPGKVESYQPAFVVFTSGSTGKPKGIVLEHAAFCTSARDHGADMRLGVDSRVLQFAAYTFDVSLGEIFSTLIHGGCVCVPSEEDRMNDLAGVINRMNVNWAYFTSSVANLLRPADVPNLNTLSVGGEAVTREVVTRWAGSVYLINIYGPAECTIWSTCLRGLKRDTSPANIGRGVGSVSWVVDATNHERLVPIGCVGELLIEGPILARGYLNDSEKTAAAFIEDPAWAEHFRPGRRRRFYKTGDLVRYNSDGTLNFIGRKDTQVKLHGQRLELGEVEHHLTSNDQVSNTMVIMPMKGYCQGRLVAIIAFQESAFTSRSDSKSTPGMIGNRNLQLVDKSQKEIIRMQITRIRKHLSSQIPTYMAPTLWIVVEAIPLTTSGKLDRARVGQWAQEMDEEMYSQIVDVEVEETMGPMTTMDRQLQDVLAQVLNLPEERISLNRSFLSLGGDSITAMQVASRARAKGIAVKVQDILQSQTISQLALVATTSNPSSMLQGDEVDTVFDLSPIQQMYFEMEGQNANRFNYHFNQSFFLRLTREVQAQDLARAIETLVRQHSMLRARFRRTEDGRWGQLITKDAAESYRFGVHEVTGQGEVTATVAASQASLDFENGPVFAADMFNVAGDGQLLFLVAHHLVIDLVSWRVILQEIEEMLESGALSAKRPFPFQAWCKLQAEHAQQHLIPSKVLPFDVAPADYAYWGMTNQANDYGDVVSESFIVDADMTSTLLGSCHKALGTEPVEVFIATLLHAFRQTFVDRAMPTVFSEGHGREPWGQEVDLSGTVGWFTTMAPLHVPVLDGADVVDMVRRTKDTRRRLPGNGWSYFTSRFLNVEGTKAFGSHFPMEILFNYLGRYQQLEREDGLLRLEPQATEVAVPDVGQGVQRLALFEISVVVVQGVAYFRIVYNRNMQRQPDVGRWMRAWEQSLQEAAERLSRMDVERTLSDFPLLLLTYPGLDKVKNELLKVVGVASFDDVEDIYPCSPMQQGLLLGQTRTPGVYQVAFTFEVISSQPRAPVEVEKLLLAWQKVVDRHAILRTVFIDSVSKEGLFDQIVLRRVATRTVRKVCAGADTEALAALGEQEPMDYSEARPPHQLTVCQTISGKVFCKLEISHTIIDATSRQVLLRDLNLAYEGALPNSLGMLYSDYIKYVQDRPHAIAMEFWKEYLAGVKPCVFPLLSEGTMEARQLKSMDIDLNVMPGRVRAFCNSTGVTVSTVLKTVWALILRCYTGSDQVCFGYLTSGRDVAVDGIEDAIGPFINMLVCCMDMRATSQLKQLIEQVQADYLAGLEHQHCSLAQIQRGLNLSGRPLFNTAMSIQRMPSDNAERQTTLLFQGVSGYDPTEYDIVVTGVASDRDVSISLSYWSSSLTDWQAVNLASAFAKAFQSVLDGDRPLSKLDLFSDRNWSQVLKWNRKCPEAVDACVHELVAQQVLARPDASAVCGWDASFSYRELDELSTRLAHHLVGLGVGPEMFVPLCFEKSAWAIVAMLAVLKAGGAYVSLNPSHPMSRNQDMICELSASVLLTGSSCHEKFGTLLGIG